MPRFLAVLAFSLVSCLLTAQKEDNIWFFGENAGLDFNTSPPTPLEGAMLAAEGCASISNPDGQLLFYTNGSQVWDRNHNVMPNGSGLMGGSSSTQAAVIVPIPNSQFQYYIFCTDVFIFDERLTYSIVDMRLNGGFGDIVPEVKNQILTTAVHEQMTAVLHANGVDVWVIVHRRDSDEFLAYLVTSDGVNTTPVASSVGPVYPYEDTSGRLKASHGGTRLVSSLSYLGILEMFDFDRSTGLVSNWNSMAELVDLNKGMYGIEFSPNDSLVYFTYSIYLGPAFSLVLQYELSSGLVDTLSSSGGGDFGGLQLGPDGKIYVTRNSKSFLDVIHQPNFPGTTCMYEAEGMDLYPDTESRHGLPEPVVYAFQLDTIPPPLFGNDTIICLGETFILTPNVPTNCDTALYQWSTGSIEPQIEINDAGTYWVLVETGCGTFSDTIIIGVENCLPIIHYDLEACLAEFPTGTNMDYSEFEAAYPRVLNCMEIEADHLKRVPPQEQKHSCTPGVGDSIAMCIGAITSCTYLPGDEASLLFEFTVTPQPGIIFNFTSLEFYEQSPLNFNWINGQTGLNNYPQQYGIRILKNGVEIYRDASIPTTQAWSLQVFDFMGMTDFKADSAAVFRIEWLPYCAVGNSGVVSVWDIDEIKVFGQCAATGPDGVIEGIVQSLNGALMSGVEIRLSTDEDFQSYNMTFTNAEGAYRFDSLHTDRNYYVKGYSDAGLLNGVNVLDLVLIQRHLLGDIVFATLPQFIAADINHSGQINALDLMDLRKALLGLISSFPSNTSWRFGLAAQNLEGGSISSFQEVAHLQGLQEGINRLDFVGIKIGDVNFQN